MLVTDKRTEIIRNGLVEKFNMEHCTHYGEPGYTDPAHSICFANWNDVPQLFQDYLEKIGCELEWSDEWMIDYNNDKAYRTSPDSYDWECQVALDDNGEWLTPDDGADLWIEFCMMTCDSQPNRCLPSRITDDELEAEGFFVVSDTLENGFFSGQDDNPKVIAKRLLAEPNVEAVVFRKIENSQFYMKFAVYVRELEPAD